MSVEMRKTRTIRFNDYVCENLYNTSSCLSVAAIIHQKIKIGIGDFESSFRMTVGCALPNIIKIGQRQRAWTTDS